jgi:hypothetical protein
MKSRFIPDHPSFTTEENLKLADELRPWAAEIYRCDGGFMAFASTEEAGLWLTSTDLRG